MIKNNVHADKSSEFNFGNAVHGLVSESAELLQLWKLENFDGKDISEIDYIDEIADVVWYLFLALESKGIDLEIVLKLSEIKTDMRARYGKDKEKEKVALSDALSLLKQSKQK